MDVSGEEPECRDETVDDCDEDEVWYTAFEWCEYEPWAWDYCSEEETLDVTDRENAFCREFESSDCSSPFLWIVPQWDEDEEEECYAPFDVCEEDFMFYDASAESDNCRPVEESDCFEPYVWTMLGAVGKCADPTDCPPGKTFDEYLNPPGCRNLDPQDCDPFIGEVWIDEADPPRCANQFDDMPCEPHEVFKLEEVEGNEMPSSALCKTMEPDDCYDLEKVWQVAEGTTPGMCVECPPGAIFNEEADEAECRAETEDDCVEPEVWNLPYDNNPGMCAEPMTPPTNCPAGQTNVEEGSE